MPEVDQRRTVAVDDEQDVVHEVSVAGADGAQPFVEVVAQGAVRRVLEGVAGVVEGGGFVVGEAAGEG